jgi:hypothetical protein
MLHLNGTGPFITTKSSQKEQDNLSRGFELLVVCQIDQDTKICHVNHQI